MAVIHVTEEEAVHDLPALLLKVRAGAEVLIGSEDHPVAMLRAPDANPKPVLLSEAIRRAKERGSTVTLDDQFGADLEAVIRLHQQERFVDPWEST